MKRLTMGLVAVMLVVAPLPAQEPVQRQREHVVRDGDTLWDLATHYYSNPFRWRTIYEANTAVVEDPHWIYPDEVLIIPGLYEDVAGVPEPAPQVAVATRSMEAPRTVFFNEAATVGRPPQTAVIAAGDLEDLPVKPGQYHAAEFLENPSELPVYGRLVRPLRAEGRSRLTRPTAHPKDLIFIGYTTPQRPRVDQRLLLVRPGREIDGAGREFRLLLPTGVARVLSLDEEVLTARLEEQFETVEMHDLAMPLPMFPDFMAARAAPVEGPMLEGRILEFIREQPIYGLADRAFLDRGARHGVKVGDVFAAYLPERVAREGLPTDRRGEIEELPVATVAELLVLKVTDTNATVVVTRQFMPQLANGMRVRRIRAMP